MTADFYPLRVRLVTLAGWTHREHHRLHDVITAVIEHSDHRLRDESYDFYLYAGDGG